MAASLTGQDLEDYRAWFEAWWKEDYSWDGRNADWLQPHFSDPAVFADELEEGSPALFEFTHDGTTRWFTRYHYPLYHRDGTPTGKMQAVGEYGEVIDGEPVTDISDVWGQAQRLIALLKHYAKPERDIDDLAKADEAKARLDGVSIGSSFNLSTTFSLIRDRTRYALLFSAVRICIAGTINMNECVIAGHANFRFSLISGDAEFQAVRIGASAIFTGSRIRQNAMFLDARIDWGVRFQNVRVGANTVFENTVLGSRVDMKDAEIQGDVAFMDAEISGSVVMKRTKVGGTTQFEGVRVGGYISLNSAVLFGNAIFVGAQIGREASFPNVIFMGVADFRRGKSPDHGSRQGVVQTAKSRVGESGATWGISLNAEQDHNAAAALKHANFSGALFFGLVSFENRWFSEETSFENAWFFDVAKFHDCQLHRDTTFSIDQFALPPRDTLPKSRRLLDEARNKLPDGDERRQAIEDFLGREDGKRLSYAQEQLKKERPAKSIAAEYEQAFRTLKNHMEEARHRSAEQEFYKYELQSRNMVPPPDAKWWHVGAHWERFASRLYGVVSDYGGSAIRPLYWLAGLCVIFSVVYWGMLYKFIRFWDAVGMSVQVTAPLSLGFYPLRKLNGDTLVETLNTDKYVTGPDAPEFYLRSFELAGLTLAVSLHAFCAIILWFLFALALRRRFQIN